MASNNPTARAGWEDAAGAALPEPKPLKPTNVHLIGPFDNFEHQGLWAAYGPEEATDLAATYPGKHGAVRWQRAPGLDGAPDATQDLGKSLPIEQATEAASTLYLYAEIEAEPPLLARLAVGSEGAVTGWINDRPLFAPTIPYRTPIEENQGWIALAPGTNVILLKLSYYSARWDVRLRCDAYGPLEQVVSGLQAIITGGDNLNRLIARMNLAEIYAAAGDEVGCDAALSAVTQDPYATRWDSAWAVAARRQQQETGDYLPFHDVAVAYEPVDEVEPYATFWPKSAAPAEELLVVDVSEAGPHVEFALTVMQGLVNRSEPRLYLLHTRYARQDRMWLDELHVEGITSREISVAEAWTRFKGELSGAVLYDGAIMDEIGDYHSDQLNQTNLLMMIGALEDAVPLTPEMNAELALPVAFDARERWANQYDMMQWAYRELFPRMNHRIVATNYPGIFLITDYLVQFRIFTFWFPEHRTQPEENLLRGILASTPPNTPIVGWWFDWMPHPTDPDHRAADAVMEWPGLLRGSYFGKVLTPSHEATNLSVHSGVAVQGHRHKAPERPALDPDKVYYAHIISDGDNLGEALMMRTRDLQWDKEERGTFPMGWTFAPAAARMAPPVLNYYLRTATANDLLVGGLGVGYTAPTIYLRAYPEQRDELYAAYARRTDAAMGWIDTTSLWLINAIDEDEDRFARHAEDHLESIYTGYGGAPEQASARVGANRVAIFRAATRFLSGEREEMIQGMVDDIRAAATTRPAFIDAWVINWGFTMDMLKEVQRRLGPDYVAVRPDVLADLCREHHAQP
jgi:hypothetical protein